MKIHPMINLHPNNKMLGTSFEPNFVQSALKKKSTIPIAVEKQRFDAYSIKHPSQLVRDDFGRLNTQVTVEYDFENLRMEDWINSFKSAEEIDLLILNLVREHNIFEYCQQSEIIDFLNQPRYIVMGLLYLIFRNFSKQLHYPYVKARVLNFVKNSPENVFTSTHKSQSLSLS